MQNALDMFEDAVGLVERTAGGHDVVENESAFIHLRQQVGAEGLIAGPCADDEQHADAADPERLGECPVENAAMELGARG